MIRRTTLALLASLTPVASGALRADCPEVPGGADLLLAGRVVLLGEMHGTVESPAFVAALACRAAQEGLQVRVGLEIDLAEAGALDAFLASAGTPEEREGLLGRPFWTRAYQDGRSSRAMLRLLEALRVLREGGHAVSVFPFSHETAGARRDAAMAETLGERIGTADHDTLTLVLTGNLHSRRTVGSPWDPAFEPMGYLLARARPGLDLVALDVCHPGGQAWICTGAEAGSCGARRIGGDGDAEARGVRLDAPAGAPHDGVYCVGTLHSSPPAAAGAKPGGP